MLKNLIKTGFMYLDTYEVLKLIGDQEKIDALLQGQVTSDISELPNNDAQISCLLDQKGFIQADFIIVKKENETLIVIDKSITKNFIKQLDQFTQFYQVDIKTTDLRVKGYIAKEKFSNVKNFTYFKHGEYSLSIEVRRLPKKKLLS